MSSGLSSFYRGFLSACLLGSCWLSPVWAHEVGCDGRPPPTNVKAECCGEADYHRLTLADVREDAEGNYAVESEGHTFHIPRSRALPTPDGCPAIFYNSTAAAAGYATAFCFFFDPGV